jgi:hypothetical protein
MMQQVYSISPLSFFLSKGQEREAYQYTKLHIDKEEVSGRTQERRPGEWIC